MNRKSAVRPTPTNNHGFDFPNHHYRGLSGDHIAYRYEIQAVFGKGSFGQVLRCFDHKEKRVVALKVVINTPQMFHQGALEMDIISHLNAADVSHTSNIIQSTDRFLWRGHVCAAFEVLGQNLYEALKANRFQPYPAQGLKAIARQLLRALAFTHTHGFVHCDLKPENILLLPKSKTKIRLIDFGSACQIGHKHFSYIQSRFYRAPEVILGLPYGPPMDMWSFACIIVELGLGRPLFPGSTEPQQFQLQMELCGLPPASMLEHAFRKSTFFDDDGRPRLDVRHRRSLAKLTHFTDRNLLDLLGKCLIWDQTKRITAEEALAHPFFTATEVIAAPPSTVASSLRSAVNSHSIKC
jgi:dual specificity tyrosine-phosphorylation-regulated kinase 2/3/4